ncbi:hypothetical protein M409DRAFT_70317 [Zasmidium cellare ATCC 36951]|uniref:Zn(2)-C6 fungal-type domain-containing protein n=1 Tax=Zasmidium cellare ATCC 36951 TaxID=1080233 RepID=A0A6A6C0M3_ZASCE|nr:uncharacterized protein M409DRAFT_70317 [Zasmidium cellare ATCC 36951]KAF2160561.1 hypothetical protein M409DRAFT_70317 [Zasmidium cellare ATCC 36951]
MAHTNAMFTLGKFVVDHSVYLGRPSRGCRTCKSRRIKCDETRPACQNCVKTNRECPGLPEEVDLIFRTENPATRKKSKKPERKGSDDVDVSDLVNGFDQVQQKVLQSQAAKSTRSSRKGSPSKSGSGKRSSRGSRVDLTGQTTFNPALEEQATTFFFNNFVLTPRSKETTRGFLEILSPMMQDAQEGSALHLATQAVAMSTLANWPGRRHLMAKSQSLYTRALTAIQHDIQCPKQAVSDSTLLTVLMFSMYESVTSSEHSVQAWARHIDGAVTIVKARGTKQFDDTRSLLLFRAVRTQMLTSSIQQRKAIPDFPGPRGWVSDAEGENTAASSLLEFSVLLPNILAKAKNLFALDQDGETISEVTALLHQAHEMQQALLQWESQMPAQWCYSSVANIPTRAKMDKIEEMETWPGVLHIYKDVHVACIRNNTRVSQILCSSVVIDALKWLDPLHFQMDERFTLAKMRLQSLVGDICYSVPFHLYGPDVVHKIRPNGQIRNPGQALGGYFLIWPLFAASSIQDIPDLQRRWLRGRLQTIARQYGLDQGNIMSSINKGRSGASWTDKLHLDQDEFAFLEELGLTDGSSSLSDSPFERMELMEVA